MRPILLILLSSNLSALNIDKLTDSIGMIESGMDHQAVGDKGAARGAWQMHKGAWADAGKRLGLKFDWSYAHDKGIGRRYAKAYVEITVERLEIRLGRKPSPQEVYAAWRLGVGGVLKRGGYERLPYHIKASCERLANLYNK